MSEKPLMSENNLELKNNKDAPNKSEMYSYFVMDQYGQNLQKIYDKLDHSFSSKTIYQLGMQLLEIYEKVHMTGYTYNDLKLDNILVGDKNGENLHQIRLVDFGFAAKFVDPEGNIMKQ